MAILPSQDGIRARPPRAFTLTTMSLELPSIESLHLDDTQPARPTPSSSIFLPSPSPFSSPLPAPPSSLLPPPAGAAPSPIPLIQSRLPLSLPPFPPPKEKAEVRCLREGSRKVRRKEQLNELLRTSRITKQDTLLTYSNSPSPFATLIREREARRKWRGFNAAPEEEQTTMLEDVRSRQRGTQRLSSSSPSECFRRITQTLRKTLRRSNLPLEQLGEIEDQILTFLNKEADYDLCDFEDFSMVEEEDIDFCGLEAPQGKRIRLTLHLNDSYLRLLAHGVAQYYDLHSNSIDTEEGTRVTVITKKSSPSDPPSCRLTDYLKGLQPASV